MAVLNVSGTDHGFLVANFAVGSSQVKPSLAGTIYWNQFVSQIGQQPNQQWEILGLTDCEGTPSRNAELRRQRAQAIYALLPPEAKKTITQVEAAPTGECMTGNDSAADRTLNRSVLFRLAGGYTQVDVEPEVITGQRPRPQPEQDIDMWPKWKKRSWLSRLWDGIKSAAGTVYRGGKWVANEVYEGGKWVLRGVYEVGKFAVNLTIDLVKAAGRGVKVLVDLALDLGKALVHGAVDLAKDVGRGLKFILGTIVDVIQDTAQALWGAATRIGAAIADIARRLVRPLEVVVATAVIITLLQELGLPEILAGLGLDLLPPPAPQPPQDPTRPKRPDEPKDDPKRKPSAYPICWATQLQVVPQTFFVRTRSERDEDEAKQARMQLEWRQFRDPDFDPRKWHVHHVVPLFLGGPDDLRRNANLLPPSPHLKGHRVLRIQPQMLTPPPPLQPMDPDLYKHPPGTLYRLVGWKSEANEPCM